MIAFARSRSTAALTVALLCGCGDDGSGAGGDAAGGPPVGGSEGNGANDPGGGAPGGASAGGAGTGGEGGGVAPSGTPIFVAVGYGGRRMSSLDGVTWENDIVVDPNGGDDNNLFRGLGYANGLFVAVGGSSEGQIFTSTNGADWTAQTPGSSWIGDVVFVDGAFIAAGGNGLRQRSSDQAVTWTNQAPYYAGHFRGIAAGGGIAVAAGHTYNTDPFVGLVSVTTDAGLTWSEPLTGGPAYGSIAFGAGVFVAAGDGGCRSSSDGVDWTDCGIGGGLGRVVFANGEFLIPDDAGYHHSADGATWSHVDGPSKGIQTFGLGQYLATSWPDRIESSTDLQTYTIVNQDTGPAIVQIELGYIDR
ncbi:MAG: hypothetical protein JNK04_18570 [Myxococcales bacterium]|nr:hypothetical protein [Myxococcales bacterium]